MPIDPIAIDRKLQALRAFEKWPLAEIERFGGALRSGRDWDLFRINPLSFAERHSFEPRMAVDLFVHGVKIGLFDLVWSCVCVFCGAVEYTFDTIDRIPRKSFHCTRCDADIWSWLDERIEVSFSLHASVAHLAIDPFFDIASYERYHTSPSVVHVPETAAYLAWAQRGHVLLPADGRGETDVLLPPGGSLRLFSYDRHAQVLLTADQAHMPYARELDVDVLPAGFSPAVLRAPAGTVRVRLENRAPQPTGVVVLDGDASLFQHNVETNRAAIRPFFSGQMLLCTESFRTLFRIQTLDEELALNVRHVALLFTDLARSTELYDTAGDAAAYGLVREHFRALHDAVDAHGGAIVKTMGDAIMAAFRSPIDAVRAALHMLGRIEELNRRAAPEGWALGLKIGIHAGSAIIVHAEGRLDYFGQTVNIAARVQGLAPPGTICVSGDVHGAPEVTDVLREAGYSGELTTVAVRGLRDKMPVCRLARAA
jgi:class 3 adenylate cyclase